ncbi:bifunctional 2',3'-cyclic-nucleotide 2'-phosphodiesterase/3'-nucleotidase [Paracoccus tegillarcae]|uniref:Bifunctional 2',3'-cyclic-nucleotide 2'-phosphodiesterase/3'-nucleotidase n=1 Tax=Paracoccus tegillarcae TaxID=1529068 RepID=A0A2K9F5F7_9RHOB|nr:bifunctional 2',3'-cyclic-nucleotide 2'-phosphodiesterase/3'-nucleotidase [Paracoccus tegillarcae]AUH34411.1 bifunctional 2',3'-cyclic-nucleotide 2'-phosphodiesterase/3'-nucleotidase [Paracoccus tegillarcae]
MTTAAGPQGWVSDTTTLALRIMATTDTHMHVLPYNYLADKPSDRIGLARTASLIEARRAEQPNSLLLDNGDFLQGNSLGEYIAEVRGVSSRSPHPAIAAMNALGYDAATLGNHDFNFGLSFLRRVLGAAHFPFTVANLMPTAGPGFAPWLLLQRDLRDARGLLHPIRIGVVGFAPPQTVDWDRHLMGELDGEDIVASAKRVLPQLKAAGADLIIALSHNGIGPVHPIHPGDQASTALAALPEIDVVIAGHTHEVFPSAAFARAPGVDPARGTLMGKPAVMAGFGGSHLGVVDLDLQCGTDGKWSITNFKVAAEPVDRKHQPVKRVYSATLAPHRETLRHIRRRVGRTEAPLTSYFSLIGQDPGLRLVAMAQRWHVRRMLRGTEWDGLPILSAVAPFRAGGRGGPDCYTDVPAGILTLRSLADLYFYPNRVCAIETYGAQLRGWLERSASIFRQVEPGQTDQPLIEPDFPSYNFDVIDGLGWQIDLTSPRRYSPTGRLINPEASRIRDLTHHGRKVGDDDKFLLATNSYRLATCGLFGPLVGGNRVVLDDESLTRDVLRRYVRRRRRVRPSDVRPWGFVPVEGASAILETGPSAMRYLERTGDDSGYGLECAGKTEDGFIRIRLNLSRG